MIVNRIDPYAYEKWENGTIDFMDPVFLEAAQKVEWLVQNHAFPENYMETGRQKLFGILSIKKRCFFHISLQSFII